MHEFLEKLTSTYDKYQADLEELKNKNGELSTLDEVIQVLKMGLAPQPEFFKELFGKYSSHLSESEISRIKFYSNFITAFHANDKKNLPDMKLNEKQIKELESFVSKIKECEKKNLVVKDYSYIGKLIENINNDSLFDDLDNLKRAFIELEIDAKTQQEVLFAIINRNLTLANEKNLVIEDEENESDIVEEIENAAVEVSTKEEAVEVNNETTTAEKPREVKDLFEPIKERTEIVDITKPFVDQEPEIIKPPVEQKPGVPKSDIYIRVPENLPLRETNISEKELKRALKANKYMFADYIDDNSKAMLLKYGDPDSISDIIELLIEKQQFNIDDFIKNDKFYVLTNILLFSSKEVIEDLINIVERQGLSFVDFAFNNYGVLLQDKYTIADVKERSSIKANQVKRSYESFKNNYEFFKAKGFDVKRLIGGNSNTMCCDDNIVINNFNYISNIYGIKLDESCISLTSEKTAIKNIDRYIEAGDDALRFIKKSKSYIKAVKKEFFTAFKLSGEVVYVKGETKKYKLDDEILDNAKNGKYGTLDIFPYEEYSSVLDLLKKYKDCPPYYNITKKAVNLEVIKFLENNFKVDEYTYEIKNYDTNNVTRISRYKVLRIISYILSIKEQESNKEDIEITNDEVFYAMTYNSLLSQEDIVSLKKFYGSLNNDRSYERGVRNEEFN